MTIKEQLEAAIKAAMLDAFAHGMKPKDWVCLDVDTFKISETEQANV